MSVKFCFGEGARRRQRYHFSFDSGQANFVKPEFWRILPETPTDMAADPDKLAKGSADLRYLLQTHGVKDVNQATLFDSGVDTVAKYAAFAATEDDLTQVLRAQWFARPGSEPGEQGASCLLCGSMANRQGENQAPCGSRSRQ